MQIRRHRAFRGTTGARPARIGLSTGMTAARAPRSPLSQPAATAIAHGGHGHRARTRRGRGVLESPAFASNDVVVWSYGSPDGTVRDEDPTASAPAPSSR